MGKVLIIGAGGVGTVVAHKVAQNPDVFTEIMIVRFSAAFLVKPPTCSLPITGKSISPALSTRYCCRAGCDVVLALDCAMLL